MSYTSYEYVASFRREWSRLIYVRRLRADYSTSPMLYLVIDHRTCVAQHNSFYHILTLFSNESRSPRSPVGQRISAISDRQRE